MSPKPIRCFDGNAKPFEPFWTFRNAAESDSGETELEIYGPISEFSWFGDEITPKMFKDQLYANGKNGPVTVRLNSPGGDLIAASVIRAIMIDYPGKVTVKIDGMAASAAVMVALAGDRVMIQASAYMMIHNPLVGIMGYFSVDELKGLIDELKTIKDGIVEGYAAKTKMEAEKLSKLMNDETWMTASEAVAYGFADEIIMGSNKASDEKANFTNFLRTQFVNVPRSLLGLPPTNQANGDGMMMDDLAEACQSALEYCIECLHQCEACPNAADPQHQDCIAMCKSCITCCAVCAHACGDEVTPAQFVAACQACKDACDLCVVACRDCASSCQMCNPACTVNADACQLCSTVCSQTASGNAMEMTAGNHVKLQSRKAPSRQSGSDEKERQAQRLAAQAKQFLVKE